MNSSHVVVLTEKDGYFMSTDEAEIDTQRDRWTEGGP